MRHFCSVCSSSIKWGGGGGIRWGRGGSERLNNVSKVTRATKWWSWGASPAVLDPKDQGLNRDTILPLFKKTNISIFWAQPLTYSFRQISILCWHNHYSFCWSLLPWASLKHGQRCPGLFKDGRKATWLCIIWPRQLCSWLSHLNYNHKKKDVPGFTDTG